MHHARLILDGRSRHQRPTRCTIADGLAITGREGDAANVILAAVGPLTRPGMAQSSLSPNCARRSCRLSQPGQHSIGFLTDGGLN
jgi:hypothetical protein